MTEDLYHILYCSRSSIVGIATDISGEVASILAASQANNMAAGVTGCLMFNSVFFAQVLEGPVDAVERTFERILRDPRHTEVTLLHTGRIANREFPRWSMAFAGITTEHSNPAMAATLQTAGSHPTESGKEILSMLRGLVIQEEQWASPSYPLTGSTNKKTLAV